jgi:serine/threonine protein kinase
MHYAFQDRDTLYLVLDLMEGGDLRYHIGNKVFNEIQASNFLFYSRIFYCMYNFRTLTYAPTQYDS